MTQSFPTLRWIDQEPAGDPLAIYQANFAIDQTWQWKTGDGQYQGDRINPAGVVIDNTANGFPVDLSFGPLTVAVAPNSRQAVAFPAGVDYVTLFATSNSGKVGVVFYVVEPAPGLSGIGNTGSSTSPTSANIIIPEGANRATLQIPNGVTQLQAPAGNVNGLIIRRAMIVLQGAADTLLVCDLAPPANAVDLSKNAIIGFQQGGPGQAIFLPYPMSFPAGFGIWIAGDNAGGLGSISWDLL